MNGLRITLAAGVAAALACTSMAARADEESGLAVGARLAYAVPYGDVQSGQSLANLQFGALPVWFDLGYRFNRSWMLGAFYQYAPTFPAERCDPVAGQPLVVGSQVTCDGNDQRIGLQLHYHIMPKRLVDPWVGLGVGWEMTRKNYGAGASADSNAFIANGITADLQLGIDLRFVDRLPIGPFIDLSLGQFMNENTVDTNGVTSPLVYKQAVHGWFTIGARAQFNL